MNVDLNKLINGYEDLISIDEYITIEKETLAKTELIDIKNVHIIGNFTINSANEIELEATVKGMMIIPCAISLKPVKHPFSVHINGELEELIKEIDENNKKVENSIDIFPIIWENILIEIPTRVVSPDLEDVKKSGNGWRFVEEKSDVNLGLEKLKDLL